MSKSDKKGQQSIPEDRIHRQFKDMAGSPNSEKAFVERVTLVSMAIKQELCSVLGSTGLCSQKVLMVSLRREQPTKTDKEPAAAGAHSKFTPQGSRETRESILMSPNSFREGVTQDVAVPKHNN